MNCEDPSKIEIAGIELPKADWEATPATVRMLVMTLLESMGQQQEQVKRLGEEVGHLKEQVGKNSKNSSRPPSSEGFGKAIRPRKPGKGKRGGQAGHPGQSRDLYPIESCTEVIEHIPEVCQKCGVELRGEDSNPYRHQIVELPPIEPIVIEHRLHQLSCEHCEA